MWKLEPASSKCGLAMNVADTPWAAAISLTAFLNTMLMSAISTASWNVRLISCWPRPASPLEYSTGSPAAARPRRIAPMTSSSFVVWRML